MIKKAKRKFATQTLSKKAKFVVFGLKKANMATLDQNTDHQSDTLPQPQQPELMTDQFIQENRANIFI